MGIRKSIRIREINSIHSESTEEKNTRKRSFCQLFWHGFAGLLTAYEVKTRVPRWRSHDRSFHAAADHSDALGRVS